MRYSTSTALVLAAFTIGEAVAGPTHAHFHRKAHEKKDLADVDWKNLDIDWKAAWSEGQKTATKAPYVAPTTKAAPAPAKATPAAKAKGAAFKELPASASGIADELDDLFDGLVGASNSRTSFGKSRILGGGTDGGAGLAGDFQNGNIADPYGSNVMKVDSISGNDFTATFVNKQSKRISINIWNKGGPDLQPLSGASLAPKKTTLTFSLAPGAQQIVAFDDKSYVSWAQPCDKLSFEGSYATTWGEAKFDSTGCGFDVSAIKNPNGSDYKMSIASDEGECVSDQDQNMWLTPTQPVGGSNGSCYVPGSKMHLTVTMSGRAY